MKGQSALLEAMAEGQVSVEGRSYPLEELFFVIATQNPVEFRGTYPLPEAQMDRFALQFALGYVAPEEEVAIVSAQEQRHPIEAVQAVVVLEDVLELRRRVREVGVSDELKRYAVDIVRQTRAAPSVQLGASPRGASGSPPPAGAVTRPSRSSSSCSCWPSPGVSASGRVCACCA